MMMMVLVVEILNFFKALSLNSFDTKDKSDLVTSVFGVIM